MTSGGEGRGGGNKRSEPEISQLGEGEKRARSFAAWRGGERSEQKFCIVCWSVARNYVILKMIRLTISKGF